MASPLKEDVRYVKLLLLLVKGSTPVFKGHIRRIANSKNKSEDELLLDNKEIIKKVIEKKYESKCRTDISFAETLARDLEKWDIPLHAHILLKLFRQDLNGQEIDAVGKIREIRNDLAHMPNTILSEDEFSGHFARLTFLLGQLTSRLDSSEQDRLDYLISNINTIRGLGAVIEQLNPFGGLDELVSRIVAEKLQALDKTVNDLKLCVEAVKVENKELKDSVKKLEAGQEKHEGEIIEIKASLNVVAQTSDTHTVAQSRLLEAMKYCISGGQGEGVVSALVTACKRLIAELEENGVAVTNIEKGSVLLTIRCSSITESRNICNYISQQHYSVALREIENALSAAVSSEVKLTFNIVLETLYSVGNSLVNAVKTKDVVLTLKCRDFSGRNTVVDLLKNDASTNTINKISEALSEEVNDKVELRMDINDDQLEHDVDSLETQNQQPQLQTDDTLTSNLSKLNAANTKDVVLTLKCRDSSGLNAVVDMLKNGSSTNTINKISEALSEEVNDKVELRTYIDVDQLVHDVDSLETQQQQPQLQTDDTLTSNLPKLAVKDATHFFDPVPWKSFHGVQIDILYGDINKTAADVVVNNVGPPLESKAELRSDDYGVFVFTHVRGLNCDMFIEAPLGQRCPRHPYHSGFICDCELVSVVLRCLYTASVRGYKSIAFPASRASGFQYFDFDSMLFAFHKFSVMFTDRILLNHIYVVAPDREMSEELQSHISVCHGVSHTTVLDEYYIGVRVRVVLGNTCCVKVDAIVNIIPEYFFELLRKSGGILWRGGMMKELQKSDVVHFNERDIVITESMSLPCKYVIHGFQQRQQRLNLEGFRNIVADCLNAADAKKCSTIAFTFWDMNDHDYYVQAMVMETVDAVRRIPSQNIKEVQILIPRGLTECEEYIEDWEDAIHMLSTHRLLDRPGYLQSSAVLKIQERSSTEESYRSPAKSGEQTSTQSKKPESSDPDSQE